jgi:glycerophosphoryl diester phosphodiesterase
VLILAHRGASADAPENTLGAFREAVDQGADGVELDARVCGSGEIVVCHDDRLDRLAHLDWEVSQTPLWKLRRADVGSALGFKPARIPLLEEVVDILPRHSLLNVELKCAGIEDLGLAEKLVELVRRRGLEERVIFSSFNPVCLWRIHRSFRRGLLIDPDGSFWWQTEILAPLLSNHSIHLYSEACTPERVASWRERGVRVASWTVDDPQIALRHRAMGVAYLITNRPGRLRETLRAGDQSSC